MKKLTMIEQIVMNTHYSDKIIILKALLEKAEIETEAEIT